MMTDSDYQLISLFLEYSLAVNAVFTGYVAVLFAFLIAAYLVAAKLEPAMVFIIVGLFTLVVLQAATPIIGMGSELTGLAGEIAALATHESSSVGRHAMARPWGLVAISTYRFTSITAVALSYIGALIFFFHQRHVGRAQ